MPFNLSLLCTALLAQAAYADTGPFLDDASLSVLSRNFYLNNDYRTGHAREKSYQQEWAQGFIGNFNSGYSQGAVGVGVSAHGFLGLRLDSGRGHSGTGLLPLDSDGRAESDYSSAGGSLNLKVANSTLKVGEMEVATPVFDTADKRLQPEYATGFLLESNDLGVAKLVAGHFTAFKNQNASTGAGDFDGYGASTRAGSISVLGIESPADAPFGGSLYSAQLTDTWRQHYANLHLNQALPGDSALLLDANLYRTDDTGDALAGSIANTAYSLAGKYRVGAQALTLAYQKIQGDTPFDFVGGDSIYLANSIKYADFNGAHEQSYQVRYDLNFATLGVPALSVMTRYVTGKQIDGSRAPAGGAYNPFDAGLSTYVPAQGQGGRHWERDIDLKYRVQSGVAKDLSVNLSHVTHRANNAQAGADIDRLYLVVEYPLGVLD